MEPKDFTKKEVRSVIERYYHEHPNLPKESITEKEWNAFYDVIEAHFLANNIMKDYNTALNILIRRALYYASVNRDEDFTIDYLIKATKDLCAFRIHSDEIKAIVEEIKDKITTKVKVK